VGASDTEQGTAMGSLVQLGNVPEWVQAATGAATIYSALRDRRQAQALDWAAMFEELADLNREEMRRIIEDNPAVAELVGLAWEAGAETASVDKRRLLAKVAAAALRRDTDAKVHHLQFLLRTVIALDPVHVTLLVIIGGPRSARGLLAGRNGVGSVTREEMGARWSAPNDILSPALSILEREGLIKLHNSFHGETKGWTLSPYGQRFLDHLLVDAGGWPPSEQ
jgi:hypothetical protein